MMDRHQYAVVTGASQGLGKAFAESLSRRGWNLVIAALPSTGLDSIAHGLRAAYGVDVIAIELDLSVLEGQHRLIKEAFAADGSLGLLVNNVGVGGNGLFDLMPLEGQRRSVDVNVQATMSLTYALLSRLAESRGKIINVASLAAFYPMPLFAVYAASKAFLLHWSLALRHELEPVGVSVTVLAPGGMYTNREAREKAEAQGILGRLSSKEPEAVAEAALRGAFVGKALVIPGIFNKLLMVAGSIAPKNLTARAIYWRWRMSLSRLADSDERCWYYRKGDHKAS